MTSGLVCGNSSATINSPLLADDKGELLQSRGRQVHVEVDDHVRQLREVELDAVEHSALVRILFRQTGQGRYTYTLPRSIISFIPSPSASPPVSTSTPLPSQHNTTYIRMSRCVYSGARDTLLPRRKCKRAAKYLTNKYSTAQALNLASICVPDILR